MEFVKTQITLLEKLAREQSGESEMAWSRFFEMYYPAMVAFVRGLGGNESAEDVVSDVLAKLVEVLRSKQYKREAGKSFRGYLKTLLRNQLNDLYRREKVRGLGRKIELTDEISDGVAAPTGEAVDGLDEEWIRACRSAAIEHVMTKTALSAQSKEIFRRYVIEKRPIGEVAKEFGVSRNMVSQTKTRIERMITAFVTEYADVTA